MQFKLSVSAFVLSVLGIQTTKGCNDCYGPTNFVTHERLVHRMQPSALNATTGPRGPLEWGQINFLHTTDTHGWLEGHLKEQNYGADWGDFVSFTRHMKQKAANLSVDLLLIDTGDLHDGAGLSDNTNPNGAVSNPIFESIEYDLLTIGNHELYVSDVTYETFKNFAVYYGDKYLTSNVQFVNPATNKTEYIGQRFRYFTTPMGLRIMSFGVIFDLNLSRGSTNFIVFAKDMVKEKWFQDAITVNHTRPIDLFVVLGHNPVKSNDETNSTLGIVVDAIRAKRSDVPIQVFGGHTHVRNFTVYDQSATGLESGRYCETLGWLSMTGIKSSTYFGNAKPPGPNPTRAAVTPLPSPQYLYSRRYLDWNRLTFAYHAEGSQDHTLDLDKGLEVTKDIEYERKALNLSTLYGCAPQTYCISCAPLDSPNNIYTLFSKALAEVVVNESRKDVPRLIFYNSPVIRFDLVKGPFTLDDKFIVSPYDNTFQFIPGVPYPQASQVLEYLNPRIKKRSGQEEHQLYHSDFTGAGTCEDPALGYISAMPEAPHPDKPTTRGIIRRQKVKEVPGYTTTDDFGNDGDDTIHLMIPDNPPPDFFQANASFPTNPTELPETVDLVFFDYYNNTILKLLQDQLKLNYTEDCIVPYVNPGFTSDVVLPKYAEKNWQEHKLDCPVGLGVGFPN